MFAFAFQVSEQEGDLVVVLEEENLERMRASDPAELDIARLRLSLAVRKVIICYVTAADAEEVKRLSVAGDAGGAVRILMRGWTFRPEDGDSDAPYESLLKK